LTVFVTTVVFPTPGLPVISKTRLFVFVHRSNQKSNMSINFLSYHIWSYDIA
jgi:hypothetical protein